MADKLRAQTRARAGGRCEFCRLPDWVVPGDPFHVDHVLPRQHGGVLIPDNTAWACSRCNRHKGSNLTAVDPDSASVVPLFNPRRQPWADHFQTDGAWIKGTSATGRATAWLLQMNAERRLELRSQLMAAGLW